MSSVLSDLDLDSINAAIREEIAAVKESITTAWLDIDGIEHLTDVPGSFVYRLILSSPVHFSPDQTVTFHTRSPMDTIQAVIVRSDDEGLVVECQKPLPTDAKLLRLNFDPTFILRALENFVLEMAPKGGNIARLVAGKVIPEPGPTQPRSYPGLSAEQAYAVEEMAATPLHLLWGPPGTGKTTTLGAAVARWLRQKKRVLVISTSNAAVDVALRAVLKNLRPEERKAVLRLGTSLDPVVREVTLGGKMAAQNGPLARSIAKAQARLLQIRELLQNRGMSQDRMHALYAEAQTCQKQVEEFNRQTAQAAPGLSSGVLVTGCTLAKMVLDAGLRQEPFDVVVLDEASMASMLYALAASFLASAHLVYAGDPKQLPPIVQANGSNAARWFGQNVYDWFGVAVGEDVQATRLCLLRTQYRMTDQIGGVVSRLSYGDLLRHGRAASGPKVEFIDIDGEWQTRNYSVEEGSYYHLAAVPLLHALSPSLALDELLLLSPFRPQRSLLAALAFDLRESAARRKTSASTIHRAQGSEAKAVVVDLTTHSPQQLAAFFRDKHCERLFNVAISRARDQLLILGSKAMLQELACTMPFWGRVLAEFGQGITERPCASVLSTLTLFDSLEAVPLSGSATLPAIYSHRSELGDFKAGLQRLEGIEASRKLLVLPWKPKGVSAGNHIVRQDERTNCPAVFIAGGTVCLPYQGKWLAVHSPNVSRVVWRVGFSHLADDEVDPAQAKRFFCPECCNGDLVMKQYRGEGWFLVCTNGQHYTCPYRKRLSIEDAKLKVRLGNMTCPKKHPLTARQSGRRFFLGCENYPFCDYTESLAILEGT
ncbi:MAG TPA: AAA domain-containing protein [Gemmataceae bacterium]|nr:AAA domain-containing protein [Gemmataceae bacterium]